MASTPNFNWATPDNTGLVKNGALDIRTLGNAIDASLVDLKGGTTGQVLAKQTNTDMDFTWSTPSTGSTYVAGKNAIINGAFDIWQRGTSFSSFVAIYTADRWLCNRQSGVTGLTISRQSSGFTSIQYSMRAQRDSGNTGTQDIYIQNSLESMDSYRFAGKTVTVSFYAKAGANFSAASSNAFAFLYSGTGTDQNLFSGYTGSATVASSTAITLTTSWQRFSITGTVATTATELGIRLGWTPTGTASTNDWMEITGVMLEEASTASAFSRNAPSIQGELAACQRYYWRRTGENNAQDWFSTFGTAYSTTNATVYFQCPQTMRVKPSAVDYANLMIFRIDNGAQIAVTSLAFNNNNPDMTELIAVGGAFLVNYAVVQIKGDGSGVPFIGFSAEL